MQVLVICITHDYFDKLLAIYFVFESKAGL
ncbi:hypothetical protein CLV24_10923 [Pontibacter ummariensis]|uniref:Uncharacterized protein n=1 Tax=Pontibacter ummariensis TaxID=1610492 RepID=A0A239FVZ9_9BACT|nr:hypothetical protein CLV24_10923 [Pontibacter ummariensis]SNS61049.1 hypothetical protein SAMN06296052_109147 [Pontibacter ummariensis]